MRIELKQTFFIAAALFVPATILALSLLNPHGSNVSIVSFSIGVFVGAPFYVGIILGEYANAKIGLALAVTLQFAWMVVWVQCWRSFSQILKARKAKGGIQTP
jgi:hypothetical protein